MALCLSNLRHSGLHSVVGNFAVNFPVAVEMPVDASWQQRVEAVQTAFEELPSGGVSYDWSAGQLAEEMYPDNKLTLLCINYLGHPDGPDSESFEICFVKKRPKT
ncbi:hypothetical protein [Gynuella sunshinyii]|uniref:Uncharacterized protein n=1 Tax=Gynuella sunshinyii YC6258 TaxID=1445510 RepID=A0A0C5VS29_9GAMM|nr:hypothetical protein [Gynuella sunshinyii]AJQ97462.1 hypothetical Protein YC6258_05432 [Gynuella sunshinyii YC6258]